jgi:hypothetical protein
MGGEPRGSPKVQRGYVDVHRLHDVNKAYPKDPFLLPHINQIVDSMAGCDLL